MDAAVAETAIKAYLKEIHTRLDEAASIAKAANACAEASNAIFSPPLRRWRAGERG